MLKKPTDEMLGRLKESSDINAYLKENEDYMINGDIAQYLRDIIQEKKLVKAKVLKRAEINENYGYQIFMGARNPSRNTLIQLCIGMELELEETQSALKFANYAPLYAKSRRDSVIISGILQHSSVFEINNLLYDFGEETLS